MPVEKQPGHSVTGATINRQGLLRLEATASARPRWPRSSSWWNKPRAAAPIQRVVDRVAAWFVPAVIGLALLTFVVWLAMGAGLCRQLLRLIAVLVIACPCAPWGWRRRPRSWWAGQGRGARHPRQEQRRWKKRIACRPSLDKTGTITRGEPSMTDLAVSGSSPWTRDELLRLAASAERGSEHPLGEAIIARCGAEQVWR